MKINRRGNLMVAVILFIIIFAGFAGSLELSLSQRLEGKRYAQRNNAIYTVDALMDVYIYNGGSILRKNTFGPVMDSPMWDPEVNYPEYVKILNDALVIDNAGIISLDVGSIYDIVSRLSLDTQDFREKMLDIMSDQVVMSNVLLDGKVFDIDWESRETVVEGVTDEVVGGVNPDPSAPPSDEPEEHLQEILMLKPIRVQFTGFYRSFNVCKTVSIYNVYIEVQREGDAKTLVVNTDNMQFIVEEYDCYE